jgi:hypothetical protein
MSVQQESADPPPSKRPWIAPTLTVHASLTALTQAQYPQDTGADSAYGGPQRAIPCSQGFCP